MWLEIGDHIDVLLICQNSVCLDEKNAQSEMSGKSMMSGVIIWLGIAFGDCSSLNFIYSFAALMIMDVNSEATCNYSIRRAFTIFTGLV